MDFNDTPEEAAFRETVRTWMQDNAPHDLHDKLEADRAEWTEEERLREAKAWQLKKQQAGWACMQWPKEYGGRGATPMERVIWGQEEGVYAQLSGVFLIGQGMCGPTMMGYASEEHKRRYLPPLASGEEIWSQMFSEPGAGSDLAGLQTRAERDGDSWIINGQKIWTSGAHYSDYAILLTRTDPKAPKHKGLTMFFLDLKSPGVEIRPIKQITGESHFNEVYFSDVRIPEAQRLGEPGEGWRVALTTLMNERLAIGGGATTGFEELWDFVSTAEGEDGPVLQDRAVRSKVADFAVTASGLKYTSYRLLSAVSRGDTPGPEASIGKLVAAVTTQDIAEFALEIQEMGGILMAPDAAAVNAKFQNMRLRAPGMRIAGGTDEILRNIIAERVLGLPGDVRLDTKVPFDEIPKGKV